MFFFSPFSFKKQNIEKFCKNKVLQRIKQLRAGSFGENVGKLFFLPRARGSKAWAAVRGGRGVDALP